ncbi:MAG: DNA-3-methyladenine glycosylase [Pyrinomonadaceae bacterium]
MKLARDFYLRDDTIQIARDLLGKLLVVPDENGNRVSGMIVETEAYLGTTDRAAHSFGRRRTKRNEITYALGGHVYVFFIYGMYYQLNVVCGEIDSPHVVLIRAIEPVEGIEIMHERRSGKKLEPRAIATGSMLDKNLTSGPGKLCIALNIDRRLNGENLSGESIWLEELETIADEQITVGKRIGIDYAGEDAEKPWRFWVKGNHYVSRRIG